MRAWLRGWWRRNIIDDAAPFTDDEAERWRAVAEGPRPQGGPAVASPRPDDKSRATDA